MRKKIIFIVLAISLMISLPFLALAENSFEFEFVNINEKYINIFEEEFLETITHRDIDNKYLPGYLVFDGEKMELTTILYGDFSDIYAYYTFGSGSESFFALKTKEYLLDYTSKTISCLIFIELRLGIHGVSFPLGIINNRIVLFIDDDNYLIIPARSTQPNDYIYFREELYLVLDGEGYEIKSDYLKLDVSYNNFIIYPEGGLTGPPEEDYEKLLIEFLKKSSK